MCPLPFCLTSYLNVDYVRFIFFATLEIPEKQIKFASISITNTIQFNSTVTAHIEIVKEEEEKEQRILLLLL